MLKNMSHNTEFLSLQSVAFHQGVALSCTGADCERSIIYTNDMCILFSYAINKLLPLFFWGAGVHKKNGTIAMSIWVMAYDTWIDQ